jgi:hypothetical protein
MTRTSAHTAYRISHLVCPDTDGAARGLDRARWHFGLQMHLRAPVYTAIYPGAVELDPRQSNLPRKRLFIP